MYRAPPPRPSAGPPPRTRFLARWRAGRSGLAAALLLLAGTIGAAAPVPDTLAQRLQACTACHGQEGRASNVGYLPRIAGKPAGYLYNQLVNFREGRRANAAMVALLDPLSDAYLREIAAHFAAQDLPYPPPVTSPATPAQLARGQALVERGDTARGIPACTACHGAAMTGALPAFPGLLGLPRDYLLGQFGAWKTGLRRAVAPDCMAQVVQRLSDDDIGALAAWLSAQPVPAGARPVALLPQALPLNCGSGTR